MEKDVKFSVHKRGDQYVLVAREYGVVVWAKDLASGARELEDRVQKVSACFSEAGISPPTLSETPDDSSRRSERRPLWEENLPFVVKTGIAVVIMAAFIVIEASLLLQFFGANSTLRMALEHPAHSLVRLADRADTMSPSEMALLRNAIRRIAVKVSPLIEEISQAQEDARRNAEQGQRPRQ